MSGFGIVIILWVVCLVGFSWWGARQRAQGKFTKPESEIGEISDETLNEDIGIDAGPSPRAPHSTLDYWGLGATPIWDEYWDRDFNENQAGVTGESMEPSESNPSET